MANYSNIPPGTLIETLIFKLDSVWAKMKWWQKIFLGALYKEIKDILEGLKAQGYRPN